MNKDLFFSKLAVHIRHHKMHVKSFRTEECWIPNSRNYLWFSTALEVAVVSSMAG